LFKGTNFSGLVFNCAYSDCVGTRQHLISVAVLLLCGKLGRQTSVREVEPRSDEEVLKIIYSKNIEKKFSVAISEIEK